MGAAACGVRERQRAAARPRPDEPGSGNARYVEQSGGPQPQRRQAGRNVTRRLPDPESEEGRGAAEPSGGTPGERRRPRPERRRRWR